MKALVVEDDPTIVEMVEDVLFSLGHEFEVATNQQDAQQLLKSMDFDYVLLDLQIPAKANRGGADKQYGINLLKDIQRMKAPSPPPVIMMTAHLADGFNLSSELQRNGVRECIAKPFSDAARPLSSVILAVVEEYGPKAKTIETPKQDIISSGGRGYRFNDWITIRDTRKAETEPIEIEDTPASRRQRVLELLGDGGKLRSTCIANRLGCSLKTVKRELETLRLAGRIEFIGPSKTGTYQLVGT